MRLHVLGRSKHDITSTDKYNPPPTCLLKVTKEHFLDPSHLPRVGTKRLDLSIGTKSEGVDLGWRPGENVAKLGTILPLSYLPLSLKSGCIAGILKGFPLSHPPSSKIIYCDVPGSPCLSKKFESDVRFVPF